MLKTKNFGRKSLNEIKEILHVDGPEPRHEARPGGAHETGSVNRECRQAHRPLFHETAPCVTASHTANWAAHRAPDCAVAEPGRAVLRHERIETTMPKAKEVRPFVERIITIAKRGLAEGPKTTEGAARQAARRRGRARAGDRRQAVRRSRRDSPGRPGGYTRILKLGFRRGDSADMAQLELVGSEYNPNLEKGTEGEEAGPEKKTAAPAARGRPAAARQDVWGAATATSRPTPRPPAAGRRRAARRARPAGRKSRRGAGVLGPARKRTKGRRSGAPSGPSCVQPGPQVPV